MSNYTKDPNKDDFLHWAKENPTDYYYFYDEYILPLILDLEQDDYFGTEGFDKRFS